MNTKNIDLQIKEASESTPGIVAYASTFDREPDAYGDVVAKGAFAGTLAQLKANGYNLPLLYAHDMGNPSNIIGYVTKAEEDDRGLRVEAAFDMENPAAQTVRRAVLAKAINKLSFAFTVLDQGPVTLEDGTKANELRELEIYEVSLVVVPANSHAVVVDAKDAPAETPEATIEEKTLVDDTEPETIAEEVKTEEPMEAKAEEPEEKAEEEEPEPVNPVSEKENIMEIETMNAIGAAEPAEKSAREIFAETFGGIVKGARFSAATPEIGKKVFIGTPQYINTVSQNVSSFGTDAMGALDFFGRETIRGNAYTYVVFNGFTPTQVAEGGTKPQTGTTTSITAPLTKLAGVMKESDELVEDAEWLVSAIENRGVDELRRAEESYAVSAVLNASSIGAVTGGITEANIAAAIAKVLNDSHHAADGIVMNPTDYATLISGTLANSRTLFSPDYKTFLGIPVAQSAAITAGTVLVGNFRQGATLVGKGGVRVEATNSDQDDFVKNLVTIRIEERLLCAVRIPYAFCTVGA